MLTKFIRLKQQIALTHCHQYMQKYINSQNEKLLNIGSGTG